MSDNAEGIDIQNAKVTLAAFEMTEAEKMEYLTNVAKKAIDLADSVDCLEAKNKSLERLYDMVISAFERYIKNVESNTVSPKEEVDRLIHEEYKKQNGFDKNE